MQLNVPHALIGCLIALVMATSPGCQRDEIRSYSASRQPGTAATNLPAAAGEIISWTLPAGWEELPGSGMRYATLLIEPGDEPLEIRVTPLQLAAKDPLANVNRWRQQLAMAPIGSDQLDTVMRPIEVDGRTVQIVDLLPPPPAEEPRQQIIAAILPGSDQVWFFTIFGPADRVSSQRDAFEEFIRTVRLRLPATAPATAAPGAGATPGISWNAPPSWQPVTEASQFRIISFTVTNDQQQGEVTVTRFAGDVGGLLANVNRWRRQLGLAPIADIAEQPMTGIEIDGNPGGLIDIVAPAGDTANRIFVAMVARPEWTWFFKFTGPEALITGERQNFDTFLSSVRFTGDADE